MPGHIKLVKGAVDPDPTEFLLPSMDMKKADQAKPYDPKASVWIPNPKDGGYREGILEVGNINLEDPNEKCTIAVAHEKFTMKAAEVGRVNPPKFEKCEDMVNLTYLNDASVFWNLKTRYQAKLIHTYSGLFVVVVNPYKRYPLYTHRVCKIYLGKRRNEAPPHLWAIAEGAYRNMLSSKKNNAMLITGESGAGKTENTKKVITYLAMVATGAGGKKDEKKVSLEDQIVATNPILESYGNAKTARNDNSSRFGKFIRIHFTASGKLAGCDIVSYLLEKSRITEQQEVERSYHIFYQLLQPYGENICPGGLRAKCFVSADIYDYIYVSQGKTKVDSIDDDEELLYTEDAFNVLGFGEQEKFDCYVLTAGVMTCGGIVYETKGRDDQAEIASTAIETFPGKAAAAFGVQGPALFKAFCKPRIKVGTEWVIKGQTCEQATMATGGIARAIFDRIFKWLIEKCNNTLIDASLKKANFCAVLDIAGFEIFEYNGFEQISINFVNEKLQQFFNHHMFVVEQEEYVKEGIDWVMVDFGMDLAAAIIMFEKPMGIWAILEEESLFPKATDKSFEEKLKASLGKLPVFLKPQSKTDKNAHFAISHYAGIVSYNVTGWLEKNKDPVNDSVVEVMKSTSTCELLVLLWADHPGQPTTSPKEEGKKKKKGGGKTVSSVYLVSLVDLMNTLYSCEPHFVRCLVPNNHKKPGDVEPPLIMHQLTCNGVLEGIRICMRGFPNRMQYPDFKLRYSCLGQAAIASSSDNKVAVTALMDGIPFDRERYRLGHTMVFFRAGALGGMEEERDKLVIKWVRMIQGEVLKRVRGAVYKKKFDQRELIKVGQRNFRKYLENRDWGWFVIIQKTRGLIGLPNPEEELRILEEKANEKYGAYKSALDVTAQLEGSMDGLKTDIDAMTIKLSEEQGNISVYTERQTKAVAAMAATKSELAEQQIVLAQEEASRIDLAAEVKSHSGSINVVKKEIEDIELAISKVELEKGNRDHTIKVLQDEIAEQDEVINKLNKEKKYIAETQAKSNDDMMSVNEKVEHLTSIKSKLESTQDELESNFDKEKKARGNLEKQKRKIEGELKMAQDSVADLERSNRDLTLVIANKDKNNAQLAAKLDEEQNSVAKAQKGIKEIQGRVEAMEEELEAERQARAKAEHQRSDLAREIDALGERLDEASGATTAQVELNKKREAEVQKLRKDVEEANIQQSSVLANLKRKHGDAIAEMQEQIDALGKMKSKIEKDKVMIMNEISDARAATDEVMRSQANVDKSNRSMLENLNAINKKVDDYNLSLGDYATSKNKITADNSDLIRIVGDLDNNLNILAKQKSALAAQLGDVKALCDNEARERGLLLSKYRNLEHELDGAKAALDEECASRENVLRLIAKAQGEAMEWHQKYEDCVAKSEELEMTKMKLGARLTEAEAAIDNLNAKLNQVEKAKSKIACEINEMTISLDQAQVLNAAMERKAKQFDKVIGEWKKKVDCLSFDLDVSQKETRNASSELFKVKSAYEETLLQLDEIRRENKTLSNEIKDIMDQITEGGRSIHEIDRIRKRLEAEKLELQSALEEAEATLEQEENKVLRCQLELNAVRQEIDRRLAEKEEEFLLIKKAQSKALDSMQTALETEAKSKAEALRMKKKLEGDAADLNLALEHAIAGNAETQTTIKKYALQVRDAQIKVDEESSAKSAASDAKVAADRRAAAMANGLEESRALLDTADRQRRSAEQELADTNETLAELNNVSQSITASKRKLEAELNQLNADLDEMTNEARLSEDKAARAMVDAARLADELRSEQDLAMNLEKDKKLLEAQCKDAATRADEAEVNALKGGRKAMIKMETRIRELESEIDAENRRFGDVNKNLRKSERTIKDLTYAADEDRKNHERMQALIDQLQGKVKSYKKQIEEAEEIAALNLAKYRKVAGALGDAEACAEANEQAMCMRKARARSASLGM